MWPVPKVPMSTKSKKTWLQDPANRERENARRRKVPRGPSGNPPTPILAEGLELAGQSVLADDAGKVSSVWHLGRRAGDPDPKPIPPDFAIKRISRATKNGDETIRWEAYDRAEADRHQALMAAWDRHAEKYEGLIKATPAPSLAVTAEHLLNLFPIGDHHLGMLAWGPETGEHWDHRYGEASLIAAVDELVRMAPPAHTAILANLGDFLHAQDDANVTPGHGNKLDVDGRHAKIADLALVLLVTSIDALLRTHLRVIVFNLPGNHDPRVAAALARELRAWYRNEPRVEIREAHAAHQYYEFGQNLLGFHHGDRTPAAELGAIMAVDQREAWGRTLFHWWHTGHVHHKIGFKEHPGVIVEAHRILPPGDAWHMGRYRAGRGMSAITLHDAYGEVGRATVGIERIRATIAAAMA